MCDNAVPSLYDDEHPIFIDVDDKRWKAYIPETADAEDYIRGIVLRIYQALPQCGTNDVSKNITGCSVLLTSDAAIRTLNSDFRGKDTATDVLSFPAEKREPSEAGDPFDAPYLGDIALAFETVTADATDAGKTPADHLTHLLLHAVLHLLGYDHDTCDADAKVMEDKERHILSTCFGIADPYA